MNAFERFGLPPALDIDEALLAERFARLRSEFHPDRYSQASALERRLAMQRAAEINDAHTILADPVRRARHLLELLGAALDEAQSLQDPVFLMQQMELREAFELAQDARERAALREEVEELWQATWAALRQAIEAGDLSAAQRMLQRLQFLQRFLKPHPG